MDRSIKTAIRFWLAITSLLSLLSGWILLAHAGKPAPFTFSQPQVSSITAPQLAPIPSLEQLQQNPQSFQGIPGSPSLSFNFPILRTRGS